MAVFWPIAGLILIWGMGRLISNVAHFFWGKGNCPRCGEQMTWYRGWATPKSIR